MLVSKNSCHVKKMDLIFFIVNLRATVKCNGSNIMVAVLMMLYGVVTKNLTDDQFSHLGDAWLAKGKWNGNEFDSSGE